MIDKKIQPDYSIKEEKLRLHAALPLLAPAVAKAIGAALGLTGTGLVLQKQIQNYFANNPGALDSIVSTFGTKPGDQPEVEEELKELTKPTTTPIETWEKSFADTGTKVPEKLPEAKGIEVPPQEKVAPPGFQKEEPLGIDILTKDIADETVPKESKDKIKNKITTWEDHFPTIEEATKAAKDVGGTLREFEEGVLQKKITFKKVGKSFDVYFDKKLIAELIDVTDLRKESNDQYKNMNAYNLVLLESSGVIDDFVESFDGMAYAKEQTKDLIANSLLDKTKSEEGWSTLRERFQEAEYDEKGKPLTEWEKEERELAEREKNKKESLFSKTLKEIDIKKPDEEEAGQLLEVPEDYEGPTISTLEDGYDSFPFSKEDFKEGALDNDIIKKTFLKVSGDDYGQPFGTDKFVLTPPRGQQEIALRFIKQKLIEDEADKKIIDHITKLQNDLAKKIKKTGYFNTMDPEVEKKRIERITNFPGHIKDLLKKRKLNARGGLIDKPLTGRSRDI